MENGTKHDPNAATNDALLSRAIEREVANAEIAAGRRFMESITVTPANAPRRSHPATMALGAAVGALDHARRELDEFILQIVDERNSLRDELGRVAAAGDEALRRALAAQRAGRELEEANAVQERTLDDLRAQVAAQEEHARHFADHMDRRLAIYEAQLAAARRFVKNWGAPLWRFDKQMTAAASRTGRALDRKIREELQDAVADARGAADD